MEKIKDEAIRIARLAGAKIRELRDNKAYTESLKDGYELVTSADFISNDIIKNEIHTLFPGHQIISEEDCDHAGVNLADPTWVIDPIDGTVGYANDQYQVAVSIAFAFDDKVRVGVVYNPFLEETFYAMEGSGAYLNGYPIRVKEVHELKKCVVGTGIPHHRDDIEELITDLRHVLPNVRDIRRLGSPALDICWVACGRMQGFYEGMLQPWDVAAAKLIATEAGAQTGYYCVDSITNLPDCINGNHVIISSPGIFQKLRGLLAE